MPDYTLEKKRSVMVVRLTGSLDACLRDIVPELEAEFGKRRRHLVFNLSGIEFIGSRGIGILLHFQKLAKDAGKRLLVGGVSSAARDALAVGGIGELLEIRDTEEAALEELGSEGKK